MTPKEVLQYNKMCAEFLGLKRGWWISQEKPLTEDKKQWWDIDGKTFLGTKVYYDDDLKFHTDWNWIMEVVEVIEKLYDSNIYFKVAWNNVTIGIATQYELAYETGFEGVEVYREGNKKESVVKAINLFLIWYNKNKK